MPEKLKPCPACGNSLPRALPGRRNRQKEPGGTGVLCRPISVW